MGTGGEAPIRYADINGDNVQELIVPTEDGDVHAYEPNGSELPGWPVTTRLEKPAHGHDSAPGFAALAATPRRASRRAAPRSPTSTTTARPRSSTPPGTHLYVWEPDGKPRARLPGRVEPRLLRARAPESQPLAATRSAASSPAPRSAASRGRNKPLDIVVPVARRPPLRLRRRRRAAARLPGRSLVDPAIPPNQQMIAESINEPAIGDLNGDGRDDVVVATNETYGAPGPEPGRIAGGSRSGPDRHPRQRRRRLLAGLRGQRRDRAVPPRLADQARTARSRTRCR